MTPKAQTPLTSAHLQVAAEWAIRARKVGKAIPIDGAKRKYRQSKWDCGTACCLHGAAHLIARGTPTTYPPDDHKDYADLDLPTYHKVMDILWDPTGTPEDLLAVLDRKAP